MTVLSEGSTRSSGVFFSPRTRLASHWTLRKMGLQLVDALQEVIRACEIHQFRSDTLQLCRLLRCALCMVVVSLYPHPICVKREVKCAKLGLISLHGSITAWPRCPNYDQRKGWLILKGPKSFEGPTI